MKAMVLTLINMRKYQGQDINDLEIYFLQEHAQPLQTYTLSARASSYFSHQVT